MIPRLDQPPQRGVTMEQQARMERPQPQAQVARPPGGIVEPALMPQQRQATPGMAFAPADTLHPDAMQDPAFQQGMGAMLAANQPALALKYGVYRNGQFIPPQRLQQGRTALSQQTIQGLQEIEELRRQQQGSMPIGALSPSEEAAEAEVARGPAGAAARIGNLPGDDQNRPLSEEERKNAREMASKMDDFEFDSFRQAMMRDILNNQQQKDIIESRLVPLDIADMIVNGYAQQEIVINPGKFWFVLRSMNGEEDLEVKRMVMMESKSALEVSDRYLLDKYAFMTLTIALLSVNSRPLGDIYNAKGEFDQSLFEMKFRKVQKLPLHMLASIGVNQMWFEQRARKLYVAEKVGNG